MDPTGSTPLRDAQAWLRARVDDGETCPCCKQFAKVYKRKVTSTSARALITLYRQCGLDWGHLPTVLGRKQADETKMSYWGLIEELTEKRDDGGRAGWWRITPAGQSFLLDQTTITKYARIYDSRLMGFDGPQVTIHDCLGTKFNYRDLMQGL